MNLRIANDPRRMLGLDGLRGLAILIVIGFHQTAHLPSAGVYAPIQTIFADGWVGVDLFFVLSGFLITGILLKALPGVESEGSWPYFRAFYMRRTLRIFPLYFLYIPVAFLAFHHPAVGLPWYFAYAANLKPEFGEFDLGFSHLWSLSVEEQFYLVWPLLVLLAGPKKLAHLCWSIVVGALALRCWMKWGIHFNVEGIHRITPARIDTFAIGALVSIYVRTHRLWIINRQRWFWVASIFFIEAGRSLLVSALALTLDWSLLAIGFGLMVAVVGAAGFKPMEWAPLRRVGALSYSMYLFHPMMFWEAGNILSRLGIHSTALSLLAGSVAVLLTAELTERFIEMPFNSLKDRFVYRSVRSSALSSSASGREHPAVPACVGTE